MAYSENTTGMTCGVETLLGSGSVSSVSVREMQLKGPCVISGVQNLHAEELVFVLSGSVDVFEVDGERVEADGNFVSILQGQRYHLHVTSRGTAKILTAMVPAFLEAQKVAAAKAELKALTIQ